MGLLDNALQALKSQYEETKGNVGLLVSDPKRYMSGLNQDAAEYNRLSSLALQAERNAYRGIPVSQEQAAAKQYIDQQQQDMALGFAGTVGTAPRKLPLGDIGEITRFTKPLPKGELYREVSGESFMDMSKGSSPMGTPITYFAETPEMALGQGKNKGIMYQINSEGLKGRPNFDKPGLDTAYMNRAGEFTLTEQPANIVKSMQSVWVSPEAYKGLSKGQKVYLDRYLNDLQKSGIQVNKVDTLPNKLPESSGLLSDSFNVIKRDASDTFGVGAEKIRYVDPKSGGTIEVLSKPDKTASVMSLEVPEQFRGKKIGESLQARALQDFPELQGQVSSKAAAKTAYRLGRRPVGEPNATLDDVFKAIEDNSSVNLVSPEMQKRFTGSIKPVKPLGSIIDDATKSGLKLDLYEKNGVVNLSRIEVPKELRNSGIGSDVMNQIVNYADSTGNKVTLTPSTDFGATSVSRLKDFYKKFGFVENKGKNKDFSTRETMYRNPQE